MNEDRWYKNALIYSLDIETFLDSNGDGVGDLDGLIQRLDYLDYLGVDAVWLAPFQPSPQRDNGYDVKDYYGVDPRYGSSGDFVQLLHAAETRGIKVLMDLVVNHTSDEHPWFRSARSDPESRYRDWYVWSKERPENWQEGIVFPGSQESIWTWDDEAGEYYYHRFYEFQPDLDMDNPEVRVEIRRIIGFWLQMGVHGFRVDAVPFLIESMGPDGGRGPLNFDYLAEFRRFMQWRNGSAILLGEANVRPDESLAFFGEGGGSGLHMMFNFWVNQHLFLALATGDARTLSEAVEVTMTHPVTAQWAVFLRNHDELDLGRLTDEQRQRVFERFAPEPRMRLYERGIRRRVAPMLNDRSREELAYSLLFSLPGTPVIRYGDELRMGDDLDLPARSAVRTPMQWADEENAGFSSAGETVVPVIADGRWSYRDINVAAQRRDPESFLNWIANLIRLRRECPEIGWGEATILETGVASVLALRYDWRGNALIVLHNFGDAACEIEVPLESRDAPRLSDLFDPVEAKADADGVVRVHLGPLAYRWFRVGGLDYAVKRQRK